MQKLVHFKLNIKPIFIIKTTDLSSVLDGPISDVVLLRTTTPLFQAYEEAFGQLESKACPAFHKSEEVGLHFLNSYYYF